MQPFYLCLLLLILQPAINAFSSLSRRVSPKLLMNYETINEISPLFIGQLSVCAGLLGAGSTFRRPKVTGGKYKAHQLSQPPEFDVYRDSVLRYAGYLNEVGEAFRPLVPTEIVKFSYVLVFIYISADVGSKGIQYNAQNQSNLGSKQNIGGVLAGIDTATFQLLASVIFPSFIINRFVLLSTYLFFNQLDLHTVLSDETVMTVADHAISLNSLSDSLPTAVGLLTIPLIVKPLDQLTEYILDKTFRDYCSKNYPNLKLPFLAEV